MTTTQSRLRALSPDQFEALRTKEHRDYGRGYALFEKMAQQSNSIRNSGRDILANDRFRAELLAAKKAYETRKTPLAECLPAFETYKSLIDEFNTPAAPSRRTTSAPASTPAGTPAVDDKDTTDVDNTPATPTPPASGAAPKASSAEPAVVDQARTNEPPADFAAQLDAAFERHLKPVSERVERLETTVYGEDGNAGLVKQVADHELLLQRISATLPRHNDGTFIPHTEWFDRTVNHTVMVGGRSIKWVPAVVAFFVALLVFMLLIDPTWPASGFWFSITSLKTLLAGLVAVMVYFFTNRTSHQPASAA